MAGQQETGCLIADKIRQQIAEGKNNIFQNELLLSMAGKYRKTVAQVILSWLTHIGVVAIPNPPLL